MQSKILIRENPRSLVFIQSKTSENYLSSDNIALLFEPIPGNYNVNVPKCKVQLISNLEFDLHQYRLFNTKPMYGCLGLIEVEKGVVTDCKHIGRIRPGESVHRIIDVEFYSLTNNSWDYSSTTYSNSSRLHDEDNSSSVSVHPCNQLRKLLSNGHFYFSSNFDLTRTLTVRASMSKADKYSYDSHFLWNKFMIKELLNYRSKLSDPEQIAMDNSGFLVLAIHGYIGRQDVTVGTSNASLSVISKLSCKRAGTRYNTRGIDDDGNVANFVETETILQLPHRCFSYTQIRGSVPLFWEQQGIQVMSHKIQISRGPAATLPAVERHFNELQSRYGEVYILNLLSQLKDGEFLLCNEYQDRTNDLNKHGYIYQFFSFDFHAICGNSNYENLSILIRDIGKNLESTGFFLLDIETSSPIFYQKGVFRTNCVDCLDRTNIVQTVISKTVLSTYLHEIECVTHSLESLNSRHSHLWAENGDSLSKIYAGTGALKSEYTRVIGDATKTVNRFYINNFQDKFKQEAIDLLLGKQLNQNQIMIYDPVNELVLEDIQKRLNDFSTKTTINVFVGTYNLNGVSPLGESLTPWLFAFDDYEQDPHLYVIGFQEIVELKPQQIVSTDPEKFRIWEREISRTLNGRHGNHSNYVILRSDQLVGTALVIYARADVVSNIRNVECVMKKGAVAISFNYFDTSLCFVTAHFASGKRNKEYQAIHDGLTFRNGRRLEHFEYVVWLGDFNYRISLTNEQVRAFLEDENLDALLNAEQLTKQIERGQAFTDYIENPITFFPTYKYDIGTDMYDTSEKARVPAWTDRILYRGNRIKQFGYCRAEIKASDHRPAAKEKVHREIYLEKLQIVSQDNNKFSYYSNVTEIEQNGKQHWDKLAKSIRKVNDTPLTTDDEIIAKLAKSRETENQNAPVGILIDFEDEGAKEKSAENLPPPSSEHHQWWTVPIVGTHTTALSPVKIDKSTINHDFRKYSNNPFYDTLVNPMMTDFSEQPLVSLPSTKSTIQEFNKPKKKINPFFEIDYELDDDKTNNNDQLIDIPFDSSEQSKPEVNSHNDWIPLIPTKINRGDDSN
ncbi:7105_t:CDS:10 [Entrophospora sp. SA101]|nr:7105_t:CDS:10 [Entrophospora sp. SA101]